MINYTCKPGDTLTNIAYQHQTTVDVLKVDNPFLIKDEKIVGGEVLKIRTIDEYGADKMSGLEALRKENEELKKKQIPYNMIIPKENIQVNWKSYKINKGQTGVVYITQDTYFYKRDGNKEKVKRDGAAKKNTTFRAYGDIIIADIPFFVLGNNRLIGKRMSYYMEVPEHIKRDAEEANSNKPVKEDEIKAPLPLKPKPVTDIKNPTISKSDFDLPHYRQPGYRRTRLQITNSETLETQMVELRINHFSENLSNEFGPARTNEGWGVNVGGPGLTQLTLSGFFLDTAANTEVRDFKNFYRKNIKPTSEQHYYKANMITILHKDIEYKGFITNMSYNDASDRPLLQMINISFMVLSEKALTSADDIATKTVIARNGVGEEKFLSDIKNMLTNPITGKFSMDYE